MAGPIAKVRENIDNRRNNCPPVAQSQHSDNDCHWIKFPPNNCTDKTASASTGHTVDMYKTLGVTNQALGLGQLTEKLNDIKVDPETKEFSFTIPKDAASSLQVGHSTGNSSSFSSNKLSVDDYTSGYDNSAYSYKVTLEGENFKVAIKPKDNVEKISLRFAGTELLIDTKKSIMAAAPENKPDIAPEPRPLMPEPVEPKIVEKLVQPIPHSVDFPPQETPKPKQGSVTIAPPPRESSQTQPAAEPILYHVKARLSLKGVPEYYREDNIHDHPLGLGVLKNGRAYLRTQIP